MTGHYNRQAAQANPLRTEASPLPISYRISAQASVKKLENVVSTIAVAACQQDPAGQ